MPSLKLIHDLPLQPLPLGEPGSPLRTLPWGSFSNDCLLSYNLGAPNPGAEQISSILTAISKLFSLSSSGVDPARISCPYQTMPPISALSCSLLQTLGSHPHSWLRHSAALSSAPAGLIPGDFMSTYGILSTPWLLSYVASPATILLSTLHQPLATTTTPVTVIAVGTTLTYRPCP